MKKLLGLILLLILWGCGGEAPQTVEQIRPVRTHEVGTASGSKNRIFSGTAKAATETKLSFRVAGIVDQVAVKVGSRVKKGALIAALDDRDANLQVEQAQAAERNAKVNLDTAKANLNRVKGLYENNNVALSEYESAKNNFAAARSTLESNRKATRLQESQMAYFKLMAPMNGIVGSVSIEKNENIGAGNVVAVLNSEGDLEIELGVPEAYISEIRTGDQAQAIFSAMADQPVSGVVSEVSYTIDSGNQTYPVTVTLDNTPDRIRPGMVAEVSLQVGSGADPTSLLIPAEAVAEDSEGHFAYVVTGNGDGMGTVKRVSLVLGDLTSAGFQVQEGLSSGDKVVTAGVNKMSDGLKVKLVD